MKAVFGREIRTSRGDHAHASDRLSPLQFFCVEHISLRSIHDVDTRYLQESIRSLASPWEPFRPRIGVRSTWTEGGGTESNEDPAAVYEYL